MQARFKLSLFVTPDSSGKALARLYVALSELAYTDYQLEIVDVILEPEKAKRANVIGTPALLYHSAAGEGLLQSISDPATVRKALGIEDI